MFTIGPWLYVTLSYFKRSPLKFSLILALSYTSLGSLLSVSVILAFKSDFLARSLVSGMFLSESLIFFSKSDLSLSYVVFKRCQFYLFL